VDYDYLVRGKRADNGAWLVSESVWRDGDEIHLYSKEDGFWVEIVPQTLGEWSRECDAAGNLIFDGDYCSGSQSHVVWEVYRSGSYFLVWTDATTQELLSLVEHPWCKVVGNIHDNPRLMLDTLIGGDKDA
jgi:YopX protein.